MTRKHHTPRFPLALAALACVGILSLAACGKKDTGDGKTDDKAGASKTPEAMGAIMAARPAPRPKAIEWVTMALPKAGLKIKVPKGTKISDSILPNTDAVKLPGHRRSFVVRKWQAGDKPLDKVIAWSKGHQIQKYKGDVVKKGSGKVYTYIYKVSTGGMPGAVYHQYKDVGGQVFRCFSNAKSADAAKLYQRCCDSLSK